MTLLNKCPSLYLLCWVQRPHYTHTLGKQLQDVSQLSVKHMNTKVLPPVVAPQHLDGKMITFVYYVCVSKDKQTDT